MKRFLRRQTTVAALLGAAAAFVVMTTCRPEPRTLFVTKEQSLLGDAELTRTVSAFDVQDMPLRQAIGVLGQQAGVSIVLRERPLEAAGIDLNRRVTLRLTNVPVRDAVMALVTPHGSADATMTVACWYEANQVQVSTSEDAALATVVTRMYDVRDLLTRMTDTDRAWWPEPVAFIGCFGPLAATPIASSGTANANGSPPVGPLSAEQAQEVLGNAVTGWIAAGTWRQDGGSFGSARCWGGWLIVTHTPRVQNQTDLMLKLLRDAAAKPVPTSGSTPWPTTLPSGPVW